MLWVLLLVATVDFGVDPSWLPRTSLYRSGGHGVLIERAINFAEHATIGKRI